MSRFWLMAYLALGLLTGCALSPQTVALTPRVDAPAPVIGGGRSLALEVVDARSSPVFGSRGGVYKTALITSRTPVDQVVREALAERLTASGFRVVDPDQPSPLGLSVTIERVDYRASGQPLVNQVRLEAEIRARARSGGRELTGHYRSSLTRQVLKAPDEAANERLIDQLLGEVLARLLRDAALQELLAAPTGGV
ncbi:MAG: YajG family lipoprotein [Candidatus Competibacteraceae bacterium]|nr:YajG family lipoprotein [Candidatus Competibacteraceae bacterium]